MRNLIITISPVLVWGLALLETAIGVLSILKKRNLLNVLVAAVSFGLAVDAFIQAAGTLIGEGSFLQGISQIRYILHGILVPLLIPIAFYSYGMKKKEFKIILWSVTGVIIVCGILMGILTKTEPVLFAKVLRYAQSDSTPKFASTVNKFLSIGGVIPLIVMGIIHLIKHKSPYIMLSGILMFIFSALAPATGNMDLNFVITMLGELFMVFFFLMELIRSNKKSE